MTLPEGIAGVILGCLVVYALLGGADFGGGVWDLLARGSRAAAQRRVVAQAIGPVWEANHVWMIVAVVLLFTAFPTAFAVIMTALHIPVTLMLVGIVLRGSSFVFRKVEPALEDQPGGWQRVFAISSIITPLMLGVVLGTLPTRAIGYEDGVVTGGFLRPWLAPFPWAVGFFTLALFALLAAVYLTMETRDPALQDDFRRRALGASLAVALLGAAAALGGIDAAPDLMDRLTGSGWGWAVIAGGVTSLAGTVAALRARRWFLARAGAVALVVLVLVGWGIGMFPWLVAGAVEIGDAAAPDVTLRLVAWILGLGTLVLVPAYAYLYVTFKRQVLFPDA